MSIPLTTALEQLDRAIAAVDTAFNRRLSALEDRMATLSREVEAERGKNVEATRELGATITQLENYLQRSTGT